ncbi:FGGY family carbohydrate kinase [Vulcanisaeta thermophila]|uniref:FGGY family carbohydrate kinase n=1 Tax=Vulcanisaeta thermophila TaxID=867917 RepID=UPI000852DC00|nr:FGGY family carbohydrate kinase [Vulcanisaeta thermophila]
MYGVIDIGTTNIKLFIYDEELNMRYQESLSTTLITSHGGVYVEHDAESLRDSVLHLINIARDKGARVIGFSTYRASVVAWDRDARPLINVITWLDTRTLEVLRTFPISLYRKLPILKGVLMHSSPTAQILWLIRNRRDIINEAVRGNAYIGTLSSYLAYLVGRKYVNDASNEALTGLWHPGSMRRLGLVYELLGIPRELSPEVVDNIYDFGEINGVKVSVIIADQQAAMVGEGCLLPGCGKITNGTGSFVDAPVGSFKLVNGGLIPLLILRVGKRVYYGVEGFLPTSGAVIDWLVRNGMLRGVEELDVLPEYSGGLVAIPSLAGLNIPQKPCAKGLLYGFSLDTKREHIARAVVEGIVQLIALIYDRVVRITNVRFVRVDGGLAKSTLFLRLLATALGVPVERQEDPEVTARGVAALLAVSEGKLSLKDVEDGVHVKVSMRVNPGEVKLLTSKDEVLKMLGWIKC